MSNLIKLYFADFKSIQVGYWIFFSAYILSAFSSPMPAIVSPWITAVGTGLLVGSLLILKTAFGAGMAKSLDGRISVALFCYLLLGPLYIGISEGNLSENILRDIIPLFFLLSTSILFLYAINPNQQKYILRIGVVGVVVVGLVRAFDFLIGAYSKFGSLSVIGANMKGGLLSHMEQTQEVVTINAASAPAHSLTEILPSGHVPLDILGMYDPAVLFSCIFLCSFGLFLIVRSWRDSLVGLVSLGTGLLVGYELAMLGLRSYMLAIFVSLLLVIWSLFHEEGLYKRLLPLGAVLAVIFIHPIYDSVQLMVVKQLAVGSNAKLAEWSAVISTLQTNVESTFFGIGWGGTFHSPISDKARFTHSLLSFYLLKSGIVGLFVLVGLLANLVYKILRSNDSNQVSRIEQRIMLVACVSSLAIGILFEPSYKMLSYGVILGLLFLTLSSTSEGRLRQKGRSTD